MSTIFKVADKQKVDMPQIQNCVTRYISICSVPNIRKLACVVPEKNVTEIFVTPPTTTTTQDDKSDPYMPPPLKRAGDTNIDIIKEIILSLSDDKIAHI